MFYFKLFSICISIDSEWFKIYDFEGNNSLYQSINQSIFIPELKPSVLIRPSLTHSLYMYYTFGYAVWQVEEASHPLASGQVGRAYFPPDVLPVSPRGAQLPAYVSQLPVVQRAPAAELPGFWVVVFLLQVAGLLKNVTLNTNGCLVTPK